MCDSWSSRKFHVLSCRIDRHKKKVVDENILFYPDIEDMAKDIYFSLGYFYILDQDNSQSKFSFSDLAKKVYDTKFKVSSQASNERKKSYKECIIDVYKGRYENIYDSADSMVS